MSWNRSSLGHRVCLVSAAVLPLCMLLSACGGGDGGIGLASIPAPPPTPTPPPGPAATPLTTIQGYSLKGSLDVQTSWLDSPATRAGTYDLIGRLTLTPGSGAGTTYRSTVPGEFSLTVSQPVANRAFSYRLNAPAGILSANLTSAVVGSFATSWDINQNIAFRYSNPYEDYEQDLGQRLIAFDKAADGSETQLFSFDFTRGTSGSMQQLNPNTQLRTTFDYDIGYSYVAMGEWSWRMVDLNGATIPGSDSGDLLFVNGDRTPPSGIPVSGTATYDARTLALLSPSAIFTLTADFGQRTMSTRIDQDYHYDPTRPLDSDPIVGIHVGGTAPYSNEGSFDIPLTGTANYSYNNSPTTPPTEPVTGMMDGAFFGPQAEQVGGVFAVQSSDGVLLMQDAFVGQQRHP